MRLSSTANTCDGMGCVSCEIRQYTKNYTVEDLRESTTAQQAFCNTIPPTQRTEARSDRESGAPMWVYVCDTTEMKERVVVVRSLFLAFGCVTKKQDHRPRSERGATRHTIQPAVPITFVGIDL